MVPSGEGRPQGTLEKDRRTSQGQSNATVCPVSVASSLSLVLLQNQPVKEWDSALARKVIPSYSVPGSISSSELPCSPPWLREELARRELSGGCGKLSAALLV